MSIEFWLFNIEIFLKKIANRANQSSYTKFYNFDKFFKLLLSFFPGFKELEPKLSVPQIILTKIVSITQVSYIFQFFNKLLSTTTYKFQIFIPRAPKYLKKQLYIFWMMRHHSHPYNSLLFALIFTQNVKINFIRPPRHNKNA